MLIYKKKKEHLFAAFTMLLISAVLLIQATYAWLTLSSAPEIKNIGNTVSANGSLEIALLNNVTYADLSKISSSAGSSSVIADVRTANESWGNLVDLKDSSYGLEDVILLPARLNLLNETEVKEIILKTAIYGKDGRATELLENTSVASYSSNNLFDAADIGVRAIGLSEEVLIDGKSVSAVCDTYGYLMDFAFRTNVDDANLLLQTEAVDRIYDNGAGATMGGGSYMQFISSDSAEMSPEQMENLMSAIRIVFVQPLTTGYRICAIGAPDINAAMISTSDNTNDTVKAPLYLYNYSQRENGGLQLGDKKNVADIAALRKNAIQKLSVIVYLDGDAVGNEMAGYASTKSMTGELNLQFATDVELIPADHSALRNSISSDEMIISGTYGISSTVTFKQEIDDANHIVTLKEYTGAANDVTIPGKVMIDDELYFVKVDQNLFYQNSTVKSVKFTAVDGQKVTSGDHTTYNMFYECENLTNLDLSGFDTASVTTMYGMFSGCSKLKTVNTEYLDTGNVTNMQSMFAGCGSLTQLDLSKFDTHNVTNMSAMFNRANMLTSLDLTSFDTSNVTDMSGMFSSGGGSNHSYLQQINLSSFDTSFVTDMEGMFAGCNSLINLDLSNFNTSNVTDMNAMFSGCSKLETLDLSSFDTSKVTRFTNLFLSCSRLASLNLSSFDTTSVSSAGAMFGGNYALEYIITPKIVGEVEMNLEKTFYYDGVAYTILNAAPANVTLVSSN